MATIRVRDFLGKPLRVGDVVVWVPCGFYTSPLRSGVVSDIEPSGVVWIRRPRMLSDLTTDAVNVRLRGASRIIRVPHAVSPAEARWLRRHKLKHDPVGAERKRARRREWNERRWSAAAPVTPEATLRAAGIDDVRQAAYQRNMSALLAGRP